MQALKSNVFPVTTAVCFLTEQWLQWGWEERKSGREGEKSRVEKRSASLFC